MEIEKKSKLIKYISIGVGSFLIIIGLVLVLVYSFITPNYRIYKHGVDVTNQYSASITNEEYLASVYSTLNSEDESYFIKSTIADEFKSLYYVDIYSIYKDNFASNYEHEVCIYLNLYFEYDETMISSLNDGSEKLVSSPSIYLRSSFLDFKSDNYFLVAPDDYLSIDEISLGKLKDDSAISSIPYLNIEYENELKTVDLNNEEKICDFSISRIDLVFFAY